MKIKIWIPFLYFIVGALLPAVSFDPNASGPVISISFFERVTAADLLSVLLVLVLITFSTIRVDRNIIYYFLALLVAFFVANFLPVDDSAYLNSSPLLSSLTALIALLMATGYWIIGYNAFQNEIWLKSLIYGVMAGAGWEAAIVLHDAIFPNKFFPDVMALRVRGTFRKSGQLAAYAFSASGILLCFGWTVLNKNKRRYAILIGALCIIMVFLSLRRSAIAAALLMNVAFLYFGFGRMNKAYFSAVAFTAIALAAFLIFQNYISQSFLWARMQDAYSNTVEDTEDSFIFNQIFVINTRFTDWFPLGAGVGQGYLLTPTPDEIGADSGTGRYEFHSAYPSILIELGILGGIVFGCLFMRPIRLLSRLKKSSIEGLVRSVTLSFFIATLAFMLHNRVHRDRTFMLFLGAITAYASLHQPKHNTLINKNNNDDEL